MGDLAADTAVEQIGEGRYRATISRDWEIWGPNGGYVAAIALRAAAAATDLPRPASFSCHYLAAGDFTEVDAVVRTLRRTKRAESLAVTLVQGDRALVEAQAWFVGGGMDSLEHDHAIAPDVPHWSELKDIEELLPPDAPRPFRFWANFEERPVKWFDDWENRPPGEPEWKNWIRYTPTATFPDDISADAARLVVMLDTVSWPSAVQAHSGRLPWIAPSLDLNVQFHRFAPEAEWLLPVGRADVSTEGMFAFNGRIWTDDRRLLASSSGQCIFRRVELPGADS